MIDLFIMNILFGYLFIDANLMYFSDSNACAYADDSIVKNLYYLFCAFTFLGYLQFIKCIILTFMIPFSAYILYKLVQYRLESHHDPGDLFGN